MTAHYLSFKFIRWFMPRLSLAAILTVASQAAPPPNDDFASRADLGNSFSFEAKVFSHEATMEAGEQRLDPFPTYLPAPASRSV